jgi:carbon storage regulator CsrA
MLALARGEGQSIIIDGNIEVKIVKWSRSSVRLAIQAPRSVTVDRDEIWRKMHPGEMTPLEIAEAERKERFAREGALAAPAVQAPVAEEATIKAPVAGTFYGSAGPGGAAFVAPGSAVEEATVVGSLKTAEGVMDLQAGVAGTVVRVLVANGQTVTAGQVLLAIKMRG